MGCQPGTAGDTLFKFVFCVATGTAKIYQLPGRKRTGTFRRERAFTVERIIYIDSLAMMMDADGYAATQVADNQIQLFVARMMLGGIATGNGALVQCMPDSDAGHKGRAGDAGYLVQLIHNTGVGNECTAARKQRGQFGSYEASQIAGMGAHGMKNIIQHGVIHLIYAARYGLQQSAAPHYGVKLKRYIIGFQFFQYQILAEFKLVDDMRKGRQFVYRVTDASYQAGYFVLVYGNFCRSGTGVDDE